ncbi:MAG: hypothetical protein A2527_10290 [Candidatus Lambdaproteobacteria bacterium RIFOXYD2_FULL_50_16]|uniref:Uncharacterized protein n=1 Tax=Candidatus Lambdaproteobacteria bacterium RIFOXYD2_FULL_50_16 TaxID=1817772 RepID=A0A1F6GGF4_9PROT|nr:MAG: hypothetical protein A2527_10290 [Candidatus Lambdaproteobacteria bacterium RIFOXYD2_FULL_50_16]
MSVPNKPEGQAFLHQLEPSRDWEKTLDALHFLLVQKWYYVAIASNTWGGFLNNPQKKVNLKRKKMDVPEELSALLKIKLASFKELAKKIDHQTSYDGAKDIWHFKSGWKEFPQGTGLIEIHQQTSWSRLSNEPIFRRAFIVIDSKSSPEDQFKIMLLVNKMFKNKAYADQTYRRIGKEKINEARIARPSGIYQGRPTSELVIKLKDNFGINVRGITKEERVALGFYFERLRKLSEFDETLKEVETRLLRHFKTDDLKQE